MSSASIIKIEVRSLACPVRQLRALRVEGAAHTLKTKLLRIPFDVRVQNEARVLLETQVEPQLEWQHLRGQSNGFADVQAIRRFEYQPCHFPVRLGKIYPGSRGFRLPNRECKPPRQAPGEHVLHRDEKAFEFNS
jgi:hypothetical protein